MVNKKKNSTKKDVELDFIQCSSLYSYSLEGYTFRRGNIMSNIDHIYSYPKNVIAINYIGSPLGGPVNHPIPDHLH